MRKQNHALILIAIPVLLGCIGASRNAVLFPTVTSESNIAVHVSKIIFDCATGIRFNWRIENTSAEVLYVYSSFLTGRAAGPLEYDRANGTILIPTSVKNPVSFPPYSYPEAIFRPLASRESMEGSFFEPIASELSCKNRHPEKLVFEVAWGKDSTQVMTEISRIKKEGRVHPANPIVHWANLARSEPTSIKYIDK